LGKCLSADRNYLLVGDLVNLIDDKAGLLRERSAASARLPAAITPAHPAAMAKPAPGSSLALPADQSEPIAAIEEMIATLKDLRQRTNDRALLGSYQAAIDRLDALAYRLREAGAKPAPAPKPVSAPSTSQAALPLGPVVVVARNPRRR
jgi:hypothetical protein